MIGSGYIQLSAKGLAAGDGMYGMASDQLGKYHPRIVETQRLVKIAGQEKRLHHAMDTPF